MGWKDWSFISFAGFGDTQSNLTFCSGQVF